MKAYQSPELLLLYVSELDVIATSFENDLLVDGEGQDNENKITWWG